MEYVDRAGWGARPPTSIATISSSLGVAVHWSAGPTSQSVRTIQDFHMDTRGWTDIAYSWLVDIFGTIYEGRGWGRAGAHTKGFNTVCHAVCVIADNDFKIGPRALDAVTAVIEEHNRRYGVGFVRPHRDFAGASTACPGDKLAQFARNYSGGIDMGLSDEDIATLAGWEHDTRKLILQGQVRAEEMHTESLLAEWRTRHKLEALITGGPESTPDTEESGLIAGSEFIAAEGKRQLAELDADTHSDHV